MSSRSLGILSCIADQHSTRRAKAQETKRPVRSAYFATWNALSPHRGFRRLHARRSRGNQLGFPAPDALASFENWSFKPIMSSAKRCRREQTNHEIADLRHAGNRIPPAGLQPLPRRGGSRQPRRWFRRARRHLAFTGIDRARTEMDRRSRRRQALWARRADPGKHFDGRRKGRHLEKPG